MPHRSTRARRPERFSNNVAWKRSGHVVGVAERAETTPFPSGRSLVKTFNEFAIDNNSPSVSIQVVAAIPFRKALVWEDSHPGVRGVRGVDEKIDCS